MKLSRLISARVLSALVLFMMLSAAAALFGCKVNQLPGTETHQATVAERAERETQREQLDLIPPPSKNRYMTVRTYEAWQNPWITVQANMLTLHVLQADANTSSLGAGGILRPVGARREEVNISLDKLGEAMAAIPQSAWPYGRVIAIEEAHKTPASAEPAVRRTMESAVTILTDLGIAAYDPAEGKLQ